MTWQIIEGDCIERMAAMSEASVDAIVTDPPYGIGFMRHEWDQPGVAGKRAGTVTKLVAGEYDRAAAAAAFGEWCRGWAVEALRVLKPGGHALVFGGTRTYHRLTCGLEDAGFEIRDCLAWMFGSGFPKSRNLDGDWNGWGTTLKPAFEPIVLARKPPRGTVAATVCEHGTGALNIDGCRIEPGRWPANVVLDERAAEQLDEQTGELVSGPESDHGHRRNADREASRNTYGGFRGQEVRGVLYGDRGGASRFFYCAKTSSAERNAGLDGFVEQRVRQSGHVDQRVWDIPGSHSTPRANTHPTVKPVDLMRWLVRLVTPPGGVVLDPFNGSGTTGIACVLEGFDYLGLEREPKYVAIARARIEWWARHVGEGTTRDVLAAALERTELESTQVSIFDVLTEMGA